MQANSRRLFLRCSVQAAGLVSFALRPSQTRGDDAGAATALATKAVGFLRQRQGAMVAGRAIAKSLASRRSP